MSRIDELIRDLCPEGVRSSPISSVCSVFNGFAFDSSKFNTLGQGLPLIRIRDLNSEYSGTYFSGQFDEKWLVQDGDILIGMDGDFVAKKWSHGEALLNQRVCRLQDFTQLVLPDFLYYIVQGVLDRIHSSISGSTVKHLSSRLLENSTIPVPPLEVQREIVSILDRFTQLEAELEAELEARRTQYEVTRDRLLDLSGDLSAHPMGELIRELCPEGVEYRNLGDLFGHIPRGRRLTKSDLPEGGTIPVFHGGLEPIGLTDKANTRGMTVMVINVGASAGSVGWSENPFWCSDGCFALPHTGAILSKYLYYCALANQPFFVGKVRKAGIPTLAAASVLSLVIPVPPLEIQKEIVTILDKLDALVNDITYGLPAEIEARRKQYEYYRNKLLTFKELDAA